MAIDSNVREAYIVPQGPTLLFDYVDGLPLDEKYKYWRSLPSFLSLFSNSLIIQNNTMDSFIKKGQDFVKSGKVTQEDGKDAYQDFSKGGNFQDNAKKAYSDYRENHKDDKKSESK